MGTSFTLHISMMKFPCIDENKLNPDWIINYRFQLPLSYSIGLEASDISLLWQHNFGEVGLLQIQLPHASRDQIVLSFPQAARNMLSFRYLVFFLFFGMLPRNCDLQFERANGHDDYLFSHQRVPFLLLKDNLIIFITFKFFHE